MFKQLLPNIYLKKYMETIGENLDVDIGAQRQYLLPCFRVTRYLTHERSSKQLLFVFSKQLCIYI